MNYEHQIIKGPCSIAKELWLCPWMIPPHPASTEATDSPRRPIVTRRNEEVILDEERHSCWETHTTKIPVVGLALCIYY